MNHPIHAEKATVILKGSLIQSWTPYLVISLLPQSRQDNDDDFQNLLGYQPCPILQQTKGLHIEKVQSQELISFIARLRRNDEESLEAMSMLAVIEMALSSKSNHNDDGGLGLLEQFSNDDDRNSYCNQTLDDSLLVEGWALIQDQISWKDCSRLFFLVAEQIHSISLPHPLTEYAKNTLLYLSESNFEKAVHASFEKGWIPKTTSNRLQASQFLLDQVVSLPTRRVGVLLEHPRIHASECQPVLTQSCLPSAILELEFHPSISSLQCHLISLYDVKRTQQEFNDDHNRMTISTKPVPPPYCECPKCSYRRHPENFLKGCKDLNVLQRLAHGLFQEEEQYDEAKKLYQQCHDALEDDKTAEKAELWHAMGAVELTRNRFITAQQHWKDGTRYHDIQDGIALQMEKQHAYQYWDPLSEPSLCKSPPFQTISPRRLFVTSKMVEESTCRQVVQWADDFGSWTTSRHYAVPTNDIPVHRVPSILGWFQSWMNEQVQPLLREQFQTNRRFYVHDAFVVRYSASAKSRFLPLHYDESTHSMVLALNQDFEGGGTYFYNVDKTIVPTSTGSLVTFRGDQMLHGGNVVQKGVRYILAVFMYLDEDPAGKSNEMHPSCSKRQKLINDDVNGGFAFGFF